MNVHSDIDTGVRSDVAAWREQQLEAVGFDPPTAVELAHDCAFDLHALLTLVAAGCPPHLAVRILAPIGEMPRHC